MTDFGEFEMNIWRRRQEKIGFLGVPDEVVLTLGSGTEADSLTAFDKAEINAGIPDINAIVVTSFVPPGAKLIDPDASKTYLRRHSIFPGSLVPAALKSYSSTRARQKRLGIKGVSIFACVGLVTPKDRETFPSILMEYVGPQEPGDPATKLEIESHCREMCQRVADLRRDFGFEPDGPPRVWVVEQELPEDDRWGCVLVAGVYLRSTVV